MGLYYSGGIDWLFNDHVIAGYGDFLEATSHGPEYIAYATAHWKELIDRYTPCCMWNDIAFPGEVEQIEELFSYYYERVPDGVVNDRFRMVLGKTGLEPALPHDVRTPEYTAVEEISGKKFELVRGIGNSFAYNRMEGEAEYLSTREVIHSFADLVSKNGNLLISVGPRADGSIPEPQAERLRGLGAWLEGCGEAIRGTRPWRRATARARGGEEIRFTRKRGTLYAIVLDPRPGAELAFEELRQGAGSGVALLGAPDALETRDGGRTVCLPGSLPSPHAVALKWAAGE
jgi:alpha-L-fucosidase